MAEELTNKYKTLKGVTVALKKGESVVVTFDQISKINPPGGNPGKVDTTHFNSPGPMKESVPEDFYEAEAMTLTTYFDGDLPDGEFDRCEITFASLKKTWTFPTSHPVGYKPDGFEVNGKATATVTINVNGPIVVGTSV